LDEAIAALSTELESRLAPFSEQLTRLDSIPGINRRTAEVIIAEIGVDMSAFPSAAHLASWAALCPGNNESAGKQIGEDTTGEPLVTNGADRSGDGRQSGEGQRPAGAIPAGAASSRPQESGRGLGACCAT
jgi:hypothetical protein